jgi:pimeloyl-ACP methyl ester carboxylesterase
VDLLTDDLQDAYAVFPVTFDGQFYYLAGPAVRPRGDPTVRSSQTAVPLTVTYLPDLGGTSSGPAELAVERIGIGRAIKLGFFKLVGLPTAEVGLRVPQVEGQEVLYRPVAAKELSTGRIALLVHGFLSDTTWMARELFSPLHQSGYDHVISWDYETFTTPVRETMRALVAQLQDAGVSSGAKRLDVVAHSMGSLVTRALIAEEPPLHLVRRAILLGPPNAGTPLAKVADFVTRVTSFFLNVSFGPISLRAIIRLLWEAIDAGIDDLQPDSDLIKWVNRNPQHQTVPLTLLMGNAAAGDHLHALFARGMHRTTNLFYEGPNDLVVPISSMEAVAAFPNVTAERVECNHFTYLQSGQRARSLVDRWVVHSGG